MSLDVNGTEVSVGDPVCSATCPRMKGIVVSESSPPFNKANLPGYTIVMDLLPGRQGFVPRNDAKRLARRAIVLRVLPNLGKFISVLKEVA